MRKIFLNIFLLIFSFYFILLLIESSIFLHKKIFKKNLYLGDKNKRENLLKQNNTTTVIPIEINSSNQQLKDISLKHNFFPLGHAIPNFRVIYCDEGYGLIKYQSDRYGFNNEDSKWDSIKKDILIIGDSFAHGACVEREKNFSGIIDRQLKKISINLGTDSSSIIHYIIHAEKFIKKVNPRKIIFFLSGNDIMHDYNSKNYHKSVYKNFKKGNFDIYDLSHEDFKEKTKNYYKDINRYIQNYSSINKNDVTIFKKIYLRVMKSFKLEETSRFICLKTNCNHKLFNNEKIYEKLIETSINQVNLLENKSDIYFVLLTNKQKYKNYKPYLDNKKQFIEIFSDFKSKYKNIFLIDLINYLDLSDPNLLPPNDTHNRHFSYVGYEKIGKIIVDLIY